MQYSNYSWNCIHKKHYCLLSPNHEELSETYQGRAGLKCTTTNSNNAGRYCYFSQSTTTIECIAPNAYNSTWNSHIFQRRTSVKHTAINVANA